MVPNGPENRAVAEILQSMAAEAGFDLKLRVTEFATSIKQAEDGDFQLYLFGWSGRVDPDGNSYIIQACKAPLNLGGYCDKDVDAWHMEARANSDRPSARRSTRRSPPSSCPTAACSSSITRRCLIAYSDRLDGYKPMPDGLVRVIGLKLK